MTKIPPVAHDDTQGGYQVVVSFRVAKPTLVDVIESYVRDHLPDIQGMSVAVRRIGAQGERSEIEGADP